MSGNNTNDMLAEVNRIKDLYPDSTLYEVESDVREAIMWALDFAHNDFDSVGVVIIILPGKSPTAAQKLIIDNYSHCVVIYQDFSNSIYRKKE